MFSLLFVGAPPTTLPRSLLLYNIQSSLWDLSTTSTYPSLFVLYTFTILLFIGVCCHGYVMYELFMIVAFDSIVWDLYWNCECLAMDMSCMNSSWLSLLTLLFGICIEIVNVLPWICHVWTLHDCRFWLYCLGFVLKLWMSCHGYVMYELFMIVAFDSIVWDLYWNCECLAMDMSCMNSSWLSLLTLLFGICIEIANVLPIGIVAIPRL